MARTSLAITDVTTQPPNVHIVTAAADAVNNNMFPNDGRIVLVVINTTGAPINISVISIADKFGRSDSVLTAFSIVANGTYLFGPFLPAVWNQLGTDIGNVYVNGATSGLQLGCLRLAAYGATP